MYQQWALSKQEMPTPITAEHSKELFFKGEINSLITGYVPLALKLARTFSRRWPNRYHELAAEAMYYLTVAMHSAMQNLKHENLAGYLSTAIWSRLIRYVQSEQPSTLEDDESVNQHELRRHERRGVSFDLREIIDLLPSDENEHQFIELRSQGYTEREVARELGVSPPTVTRIKQRLYRKFQKLNGEIL